MTIHSPNRARVLLPNRGQMASDLESLLPEGSATN